MTEPQLWVGYYQLTYLAQPQDFYFGHIIGFAQSRDEFQQKVEHYKTQHQCKLVSQLAPLPALTWFQRHGHQAAIFAQAQQLKVDELRFLLAQQENHRTDETRYLIEESTSVAPFIRQPSSLYGVAAYLPERLINHSFFEQLTSTYNPKEGLYYPNPAFQANEQATHYYAVIDGVKSFTLPQLSEHEGKTESLYKGELRDKMDSNAPYLAQLTVTNNETSPFVQLLFTQAEQPWIGAWDDNPAIFIRSHQSFETVAYHLRKFIHLYNQQNEKWYFFRFYDPVILVAYLRYIAQSPTKLASFFGVRDGQCVVESFAARIGNRFYTFSLSELPHETQPSAVGFDAEFEQFLAEYDKRQLLEKLQTEIIPAEFKNENITLSEIEKCFHKTLELGFKMEGSIIRLVKILCYLSGDIAKLKHYWKALEKEYGNDLTEVEISELLYEKIKIMMKSQE
ncbi:DUF4123 domain-containing protein [Actinobacillus equuli]|uniref:DUF4123 domain-containing protein n=1 Tax=Actinobacillus equuli TaxID=718 RepID=UPI0024426696|nr:DUF4123 domain-containing protein [Actinobacillus equuli]WGE76026.1 DUF4123 domain-containing protein [Actinobacillus equuli subsp. haemolyticus]WGE78102.1 DUF4123 domain-containing protein [Actinobacillus equuli subsp. haemolyticus]